MSEGLGPQRYNIREEGSIAGGLASSGADKKRPQWWNMAMTLGHLETWMHAARVLESPAEYKQALAQYTKKLADEGYRAKAEELIRDLLGPVYFTRFWLGDISFAVIRDGW
ncbi:hypothetical protein B0H14DRAFT_3521826 [Mycena olivaceomarginata]|nr:hypothetical protein B0H14DRAFT_3521826 [Mycena olivaceomarginata]